MNLLVACLGKKVVFWDPCVGWSFITMAPWLALARRQHQGSRALVTADTNRGVSSRSSRVMPPRTEKKILSPRTKNVLQNAWKETRYLCVTSIYLV